MQQSKRKTGVLFFLKLIVSVAAIVYVLQKISLGNIVRTAESARFLYLFWAFLFFVVSKTAAAHRTYLILRVYNIPITPFYNLRLYWTGMFYNLFLPGGIGGDVYKTVVINKMHTNGIKVSGTVILMDRISGVTALMVLALLFLSFTTLYPLYGWVTFVGIPVVFTGFVTAIVIFTPRLKTLIGKLLVWSFLVQTFQVLSVFCILLAFGITCEQNAYLFIFLISSVAAMLPFSIGGIGIREMVFLTVSGYLSLNKEMAVSISLTFYVISAVASLTGAVTALENREKVTPH